MITIQTILESEQPIQLGDVLFLNLSYRKHLNQKPEQVRDMMEREAEFSQARADNRYPDWWSTVPGSVRQYLWATYIWSEADPLSIVPDAPFLPDGVGYILLEDGTAHQAFRIFDPKWRLQNIRQLAELEPNNRRHTVMFGNLGQSQLPHTRFLHTTEVYVLGMLQGHRIELTPQELEFDLLCCAGHDAMTAGLGDTFKKLAPIKLCEERNFRHILRRKNVQTYLESRGIDPIKMYKRIRGFHPTDKLHLDIPDRMAYVGRDAMMFSKNITASLEQRRMLAAQTFFKKNPAVCTMWECIDREEDMIYFNDWERLFVFLQQRMHLFNDLYLNPYTRVREQMVAQLLGKYAIEQGLITYATLLEMVDSDLVGQHGIFEKLTDQPYALTTLGGVKVCVECFTTNDEARIRQHELRQEGVVVSLIETLSKPPSPGTNWLVKRNENIGTFAAMCPKETNVVRSIFTQPLVRLYFIPQPPKWLENIEKAA